MANFEFRSRGLGLDTTPGCFVCGGGSELRPNIAAFVKSRPDGEDIVRLFGRGARLDYRDFEPKWLQVKVGACPVHKLALARLDELTSANHTISAELIAQAKQA